MKCKEERRRSVSEFEVKADTKIELSMAYGQIEKTWPRNLRQAKMLYRT